MGLFQPSSAFPSFGVLAPHRWTMLLRLHLHRLLHLLLHLLLLLIDLLHRLRVLLNGGVDCLRRWDGARYFP